MTSYLNFQYGYRLPDQDKDLLYFDIKFFDGSPIFTYPLICVRPFNPVFLKKMNSDEIVNEFLADMISAVPILLGENYKTPVFFQPDYGLSSASQVRKSTSTSGSFGRPRVWKSAGHSQSRCIAVCVSSISFIRLRRCSFCTGPAAFW